MPDIFDSLRQVYPWRSELYRTCCSTLCFVLVAINHRVQQIWVGDTHFLRGPLSGRMSTNPRHPATHKETEGHWSSIEVDSAEDNFNLCQVNRPFLQKKLLEILLFVYRWSHFKNQYHLCFQKLQKLHSSLRNLGNFGNVWKHKWY